MIYTLFVIASTMSVVILIGFIMGKVADRMHK